MPMPLRAQGDGTGGVRLCIGAGGGKSRWDTCGGPIRMLRTPEQPANPKTLEENESNLTVRTSGTLESELSVERSLRERAAGWEA